MPSAGPMTASMSMAHFRAPRRPGWPGGRIASTRAPARLLAARQALGWAMRECVDALPVLGALLLPLCSSLARRASSSRTSNSRTSNSRASNSRASNSRASNSRGLELPGPRTPGPDVQGPHLRIFAAPLLCTTGGALALMAPQHLARGARLLLMAGRRLPKMARPIPPALPPTAVRPGSAPPWFCRFACCWLCAASGLGLGLPSPRHKISFVAFSC